MISSEFVGSTENRLFIIKGGYGQLIIYIRNVMSECIMSNFYFDVYSYQFSVSIHYAFPSDKVFSEPFLDTYRSASDFRYSIGVELYITKGNGTLKS